MKAIAHTLSKTLLIATALGIASFHAQAQDYRFTYSKLYSQAKYNNDPQFDLVKVGYFFVDANTKQRCKIVKAWMENEDHYEAFTIPASQELPLPIDTNLKSANPLVYVDLEQDMRCDFSMVVMMKAPYQDK
ncbi:MAG: DUF2987 domain-containing protein, partial [Vibrio sp.]